METVQRLKDEARGWYHNLKIIFTSYLRFQHARFFCKKLENDLNDAMSLKHSFYDFATHNHRD